MRWPWVSAARLDDLRAEIDHLRAQNASLTDSLVRIQRREAGLPETPKQPRPAPTPMPGPLKEFIDGWLNPSLRRELRAQAYRRNAAGESWDAIQADMQREATPQLEGALP